MNVTVRPIPSYSLRALQSEAGAFAQLGEIYLRASDITGNALVVDCSRGPWIDAHLAAGVMAVGYLISKIHNRRLRFTNLKEDTKSLLQDTGLFGRGRAKKRGTLIPLLHFKPGDSKKFAGYTQDHFANKPRPSMSPAVTEKFFEGIDEIFSNAELHSKTQFGMFACGQVLPRQSRLNFSIVDMGIGFQEVIRRSLGRDMGPAEAIDWAMKGRNTTRSGDIPGGLGLKILKAFIRINCGKLSVVSHHGY
jgi:hypothetical protein